MPAKRITHYDVLGVRSDARLAEIQRAYGRIRKELDHEAAAPDPRREAQVRNAYEVLSDEKRRAEYDAMLAAPPPPKESGKRIALATLAVVVIAAAGGAFFLLRPQPAPAAGAKTPDELARMATAAMGRLEALDVSGKGGPIGLAFAVEENTMVTSCTGIAPTSQLTVKMPPRVISARIAQVDQKMGVCKIVAEGVGGKPLPITGVAPKPGDKVYAVKMNAVGEANVVEATVKSTPLEDGVRSFELSVPVLEERRGGPVLDAYGRVIGVAMFPEAAPKGRVVALSSDWALPPKIEATPAPSEPPRKAEPPQADDRLIGPRNMPQREYATGDAVDAAVNKAMGAPADRR